MTSFRAPLATLRILVLGLVAVGLLSCAPAMRDAAPPTGPAGDVSADERVPPAVPVEEPEAAPADDDAFHGLLDLVPPGVEDDDPSVEELTPALARQYGINETKGVVVMQVERGSEAAEAGLRAGDVIVELDQEEVDDLEEFERKLQEYEKGDTILFLVKRRGSTIYLTLKIEE